jgi:melibiose permease/lactose/raffinose/galactose permease
MTASLVFVVAGYVVLALAYLAAGVGHHQRNTILIVGIANTVEYNERKTGERHESLIFTIRPFMAKLGNAVIHLLVMAVYLAIGVLRYTNEISDYENKASRKQITEAEKLQSIRGVLDSLTKAEKVELLLSIVAIPVLLLCIVYVLYRWKYIIDEKLFSRMQLEISTRSRTEKEELVDTNEDLPDIL